MVQRIGREVFNGVSVQLDATDYLSNVLMNGLNLIQENVMAEISRQIEEKLKDWEPTQNVRVSVEIVAPDGKG